MLCFTWLHLIRPPCGCTFTPRLQRGTETGFRCFIAKSVSTKSESAYLGLCLSVNILNRNVVSSEQVGGEDSFKAGQRQRLSQWSYSSYALNPGLFSPELMCNDSLWYTVKSATLSKQTKIETSSGKQIKNHSSCDISATFVSPFSLILLLCFL